MAAINKSTSEILPETGFIRLESLIKFIPLGRSTIWRKSKQGTFPKPVKLSANVTAWKAEDIRAWMADLERGGAHGA
jgi:prophage regulatory protein